MSHYHETPASLAGDPDARVSSTTCPHCETLVKVLGGLRDVSDAITLHGEGHAQDIVRELALMVHTHLKRAGVQG